MKYEALTVQHNVLPDCFLGRGARKGQIAYNIFTGTKTNIIRYTWTVAVIYGNRTGKCEQNHLKLRFAKPPPPDVFE
jgi:hypothetical protein